MKALAVLYGGNLSGQAFEEVFPGTSALNSALERAASFPGVARITLLLDQAAPDPALKAPLPGLEIRRQPRWTHKGLLDALAELAGGYDLTYYAWADCPLLDPSLAGALMKRHLRYAAEYTYADGWPYGFAPELLAPGVAAILAKIWGDADGPVERDALFQAIQKDINAFDIETEIAPTDLRSHRLSLSADSRRNLMLLRSLTGAGLSGAGDADKFIAEKPALLRTLPSFYAIQAARPCPRPCPLCPYPLLKQPGAAEDFMEPARFAALLDKIEAFSGDAVIDLSLWGEIALHPRKMEIFTLVLSRPALSLIIETSGLGWKREEIEALAAAAFAPDCKPRLNRMAPLSWIVSLDAADSAPAPGAAFSAGADCAKLLTGLFPKDAYVQAVRVQGEEDAAERFYRSWKEAGANIIIQKYDDFCGFLPKRQASDLSPVKRQPCWHLMRDMNILLDGSVPRCREDLAVMEGTGPALGSAFDEPLETIWSRGEEAYRDQCAGRYEGICGCCDEYYTFNF
ncbi:MAG: spiro-SPASM protein [Treponema sp.]|jgi:spiro-SPASM protein|nr:spiro-SPASM protein [Treponema sp.]